MTVLQLLRQALSRGRAATRSILKPIRPFKNASRNQASVTTLSNATPTSLNLVLANGTINSTQYTAENTTVRSVVETIRDAPSAPPTLDPNPAVVLGSPSTPAAPLLPTAPLPSPLSPPIVVPAIPDASLSIDNSTPHADEEPQTQLSQRAPSTPSVYLRSLAPSPELPTPCVQHLASPSTPPTQTVPASAEAPPASALPIPFTQLPTAQAPSLPARDLVRSYIALSHLHSLLRPLLDDALPCLVTALLQLTPTDFIGASVQQPNGDRYTFKRVLGCGAMGWVMEAHTHDGRTVAVKMQNRARMLGAARTQVVQEARVMAKITQQAQTGPTQTSMPCLAGSLASWTDFCFDYLVMDMYPQNLLQWVYKCADHKFPFILAAAEMLAGLDRLHRMGYVHCDIKHENFLVSSTGHVVLADFGLVETVQQAQVLFENGTYGYMAPEMLFPGLFGDGVIDTRIDVWSLGLVLLEMYVRVQHPLYGGGPNEDVKLSVATRDPLMMDPMRMLKTHNPVLYDLLSKMLVRDPRYRWSTDALMQHEFFRDVQWGSLEQWAKTNDFITATPRRPIGKGLRPSEYRKRAGEVVGINSAAIDRIAKHISTESPENYYWFNAKVHGIA